MTTSEVSSDCRLVMQKVRCTVPLERPDLPDEFFPGHLSVALINAVFPARNGHDARARSAADRYCRRFGIARTRTDRWELPPVEEQETLLDLVRRGDELAANQMAGGFSWTGMPCPKMKRARTEDLLCAARALLQLGIRVLQDVVARDAAEIEHRLRRSARLDESTIRSFLMYSGDDDFVQGDIYVRTFVAEATGRGSVSATEAEDLVRWAAHELILSPRYLDYELWKYGRAEQQRRNLLGGRPGENPPGPENRECPGGSDEAASLGASSVRRGASPPLE